MTIQTEFAGTQGLASQQPIFPEDYRYALIISGPVHVIQALSPADDQHTKIFRAEKTTLVFGPEHVTDTVDPG